MTNSNCKLFLGLELTSYIQAADDSKRTDSPALPGFTENLQNLLKWRDEFNFCDDLRIKWNWMKYKVLKAEERRNIQTIENRLNICEE